MPKHRKKNKIKVHRITCYKKEKCSELNSNKFELNEQEKQDKHGKQDKQDKQEQLEPIIETSSQNLDIWDEISLKEIQAGGHTSLFEEKSNYQNITLYPLMAIRAVQPLNRK